MWPGLQVRGRLEQRHWDVVAQVELPLPPQPGTAGKPRVSGGVFDMTRRRAVRSEERVRCDARCTRVTFDMTRRTSVAHWAVEICAHMVSSMFRTDARD